MKKIENNCVVEIEFQLKTRSGETIDSANKDNPLIYTHGQKKISDLLERQLSGRVLGESFRFNVRPEDAYGVKDSSLIKFVDRTYLGADFAKLEVGLPLEVSGSDGEKMLVRVHEIKDDGILIDANHPLAGETLTYFINVLSIV